MQIIYDALIEVCVSFSSFAFLNHFQTHYFKDNTRRALNCTRELHPKEDRSEEGSGDSVGGLQKVFRL